MGHMLELRSFDSARIPTYEARPQGAPRGAMVDGYYAIAPATFERLRPGLALGYSEAEIAQGRACWKHFRAIAQGNAGLIAIKLIVFGVP